MPQQAVGTRRERQEAEVILRTNDLHSVFKIRKWLRGPRSPEDRSRIIEAATLAFSNAYELHELQALHMVRPATEAS